MRLGFAVLSASAALPVMVSLASPAVAADGVGRHDGHRADGSRVHKQRVHQRRVHDRRVYERRVRARERYVVEETEAPVERVFVERRAPAYIARRGYVDNVPPRRLRSTEVFWQPTFDIFGGRPVMRHSYW